MQGHPYKVIGTGEEENFDFFMFDCLLKSRIETGEETTDDEDVNIYLTGLLISFLDSSFYKCNGHLLSWYDSEVFERSEIDPRTSFRTYKANGDHSLIAAGIFDENKDKDALVERGRLYYSIASSQKVQLRKSRSGASEVLEKLSERFETYVGILSHMGSQHLDLVRKLSQGELYHLQRQVNEITNPIIASLEMDRFLEAYYQWMESGSESSKEKVNNLGKKLSELYPSFKFNDI